VVSRAVHALGVFEGNIAEGLEAVQARHPELDIGSYPFYRSQSEKGFAGGGVALVTKGTDLAEVEAATAEITAMLEEMGARPVQGEPPAA
jgi:molybdopterin-biosynthesis enzyme MoeA-like protein